MTERELTLQEAGPDDVAGLVGLVNDAYGRTETASGWTSEDDILEGPRVQPADVEAILGEPGDAMLVAQLDGQLVGCVYVHPIDPGVCEVGMLSVHPKLQAEGLGRGILARAERYAREQHDAERIVLHVLGVREELIGWYERRGYERTGELRPFEPEEPQRSLVGELAFVVLEKPLG